jgi:hypothetical protein
MYSAHDTPKGWVAPFGHSGIKACSRLLQNYRSVPRPSSPPGAKASTECPSLTQTSIPILHRNNQRKDNAAQKDHIAQGLIDPNSKPDLAYSACTYNASEHCNPIMLGQPNLPKETRPNRVRHPHEEITDTPPPPPGRIAQPVKTPSCPARPEAHQNLIHSCQRPSNTQTISPTPRHTAIAQGSCPDPHSIPRQRRLQAASACAPAKTHASQDHGGDRDRTDDPLLAKQVLSQLSYTPQKTSILGQGGFEPPTPRLSSVCSNQLSY